MTSAKGLRVEKIGGTSMTRFPEIIKNIILYNPDDIYNRIYVVSAYDGITNMLLEHKKTRVPGIYKKFKDRGEYNSALKDLKKHLFAINEGFVKAGLNLDEANQFISERIAAAFNILKSMDTVLASGYVNRNEVLLASRELLASLGEMHSAFNSANILKNLGYNTTFVDLSGWQDDRELSIDDRIKDVFSKLDPTKSICFVTGYTKGVEGIMREFDRGYSEVTFSKIAVLLKAEEAIIHKEYHLSSGDPKIIGEDHIHPVCNTNFDVADQLADVGMEAIHPKASKPLENMRIPIRIKNAFDPEHDGTFITNDYIGVESKIEIIAGSDRIFCLEGYETQMVGEVGFDLKIMEVLKAHNVSYITKMTNANTIDMIINEEDFTEALVQDLGKRFHSVTSFKAAIVCAIGSNIAKPGILAAATKALADEKINVMAISQTSRQTNMQFILERDDYKRAQQALHRALCE